MARAHVEIIHEVHSGEPGDWNLCFQWVRYHYTDGSDSQMGYRFIWRRPNNNLQAAMGQARIPCASNMFDLIKLAINEGWFITAEKNRDDEILCDELPEQTNIASGKFSREDSEQIAHFMVNVGQQGKNEAIRHLRECPQGARQLTICDPYFLGAHKGQSKEDYIAVFNDIFPPCLSQVELFVKTKVRDKETADIINELCKKKGIKLICRETEDIHDRIWIVNSSHAYVVGTSFNGLGNKCAFILDLPDEDMRRFLRELNTIREQTTISKSA